MPFPRAETGERTCEQCGVKYVRRAGTSIPVFYKQRYCGTACARAARAVSPRYCKFCRGVIKTPANGQVKKRAYCGLSCANRARGKKYPYAQVRVDGRVMLEHRHVMEQVLGRKLHRHEQVHHKNGSKKDNRPDNLELWTKSQPSGQRVSDLIDFILQYYRDEVVARL